MPDPIIFYALAGICFFIVVMRLILHRNAQPVPQITKPALDMNQRIRGDFKTRVAWYEVDLPWYKAWWRSLWSSSRISLIETIHKENETERTLIGTEHEIEKFEIQSETALETVKLRAGYDIENLESGQESVRLQVENSQVVTAAATERGETRVAYEQYTIKNMEITEAIRLKEAESGLMVEQHRGMKEVDKQVYLFEKEIDAKAAIIARIAPVYEAELLTQKFSRALEEWDRWFKMPESKIRTKMLKRLSKNVKTLDEAIDVRGQGLIQGNNRPELEAMGQD